MSPNDIIPSSVRDAHDAPQKDRPSLEIKSLLPELDSGLCLPQTFWDVQRSAVPLSGRKSLILLSTWMAVVAAGILLIEISSVMSPESYSHLLHATNIPLFFLQFFSKLHGPITVMYLAHQVLSTARRPFSTLGLWLETVWLNARSRRGLISLLPRAFVAATHPECRHRAYTTLLILGTTIISLYTPSVLNKTYSLDWDHFDEILTLPPSAFASSNVVPQLILKHAESGGGGSVVTELGFVSVNIDDWSIYAPTNATRSWSPIPSTDTPDFIYIDYEDDPGATRTGFRVQGSCRMLRSDVEGADEEEFTHTEVASCANALPFAISPPVDTSIGWQGDDMVTDLAIQYCMNRTSLVRPPSPSNGDMGLVYGFEEKVLGWIGVARGAVDLPVERNFTSQSAFTCESTVTLVQATFDDSSNSFDLASVEELSFCNSTNGRCTPDAPLSGLTDYMHGLNCSRPPLPLSHDNQASFDAPVREYCEGRMDAQRISPIFRRGGRLLHPLATVETFIESFRRVMTIMPMTFANLTQNNGQGYPVGYWKTIVRYERRTTFFIVPLSFLGMWFAAMVYLTVRFRRSTSLSSLSDPIVGPLLDEKYDTAFLPDKQEGGERTGTT